MFNFSARQLHDTLANFLYPCQPRPCPSNWPEHWQPPVNPPPYDHNLFCSLVLKHESRSPEFVWGFQCSLPGSKIHHLGQEKSNSLRGPTQAVNIITWSRFITGVRTNIYSVSQMILQFSFLFYHAHEKNSILSITGFSLSKNICGAF